MFKNQRIVIFIALLQRGIRKRKFKRELSCPLKFLSIPYVFLAVKEGTVSLTPSIPQLFRTNFKKPKNIWSRVVKRFKDGQGYA